MTERKMGELEKRINDLLWQNVIDEKSDADDFNKIFEEMWSTFPVREENGLDVFNTKAYPPFENLDGKPIAIVSDIDFAKFYGLVMGWKRKQSGR